MCVSPLRGWLSRTLNKNGKRVITFNVKDAYLDMPLNVPCGQCWQCRLNRSREWAMRMEDEARQHDENCFLTLTYAPEHLPSDGSLSKREVQLFQKRMRKYVWQNYHKKIKFYSVGEYGDERGRPHYHIIVFGFNFPDRKFFKMSKSGCAIYLSKELEKLWEFGFCPIGDVTFQSCAYCARYVMKKLNGKRADEYPCRSSPDGSPMYDPESGEVLRVLPEFSLMSTKDGGIGVPFFRKYEKEVIANRGKMIHNGTLSYIPKRYKQDLKKRDPAFIKWLNKRISDEILAKQGEVTKRIDNPQLKVYSQYCREKMLENKHFESIGRLVRSFEKLDALELSELNRSYVEFHAP